MGAVESAREWLDSRPLFLDTETTGLDGSAEVVEIAILDSAGMVLFESLIKPSTPIPAHVTDIHGISNEMVADAPTWPQVHDRVSEILSGRTVVIYNADYDERILRQTSGIYGLTMPDYRGVCAMLAYAEFNGEWSEYRGGWRWVRLAAAAAASGVRCEGAHRARADALMCLGVVEAMVGAG